MKEKCIESLSTALTSASRWRAGLDNKWPDHRNQKAAKQLDKLAAEAANLSEAQWTALAPFFGSERWGEALRRTSRMVGFARRRVSLVYFVRQLAGLLSEPATAA